MLFLVTDIAVDDNDATDYTMDGIGWVTQVKDQ